MPRSILLGRPLPAPGEPLFTDEDTAYALALAEEEADTCPKCGLLKVVCRDPAYQFAFEAKQEQCHASYALASFQLSEAWENKQPETRAATELSIGYRDGVTPPAIDVGLDLAGEGDEPNPGGDQAEDE